MLPAILLIVIAIAPRGEVFVAAHAPLLERNHVYADDGDRTFTQVIAWDSDSHVWFWRMDNSMAMLPEYDHASRLWVLRWVDKDGVGRTVYSRTYDERHLQYDIETADREYLPVDCRRPLRAGK